MVESELVRHLLQNRDALVGFILVLVRDYDLAEEVFQETAVAILEEAEKGRRPANFMAWARTVARHRAADHFRRRARRQEHARQFEAMAEAVARAFDENAAVAGEADERLRALRDCLKRLGRRARAIVDLRYRDRLPLSDIAAAVRWKEASVKVALSKARRALAECVGTKLRTRGATWT